MEDTILHNVEHHYGPVGRLLDKLSKAFAIFSGVTLTLMAFMSLASVFGRAILSTPITGDYELVQVMSAIAVAMALPYCQMIRGHVIVDFFTAKFSKRANNFLDVIANLLLAIGAFTLAWRMTVGMFELRISGDASMLLNLSTWYGYAPIILAFILFGCCTLYSAWEDFKGEGK